MNKFEKQLEKWNHGVLRGAQAKLAKALNVSTATTALWATGKRRPSKGYIAQMARLFGLDIYQVIKLFEMPVSVTYPRPEFAAQTLHEEKDAALYQANLSNHYTEETAGPSNSVPIPFLDKLPANYPQIPEETILEWWSIPRRYASGIKYIIRSQDIGLHDAIPETDLCFIKPCTTPDHGQITILADVQGNLCIGKAVRKQNSLSYQSLSGGKIKNIHNYQAIGVILRRIKPY